MYPAIGRYMEKFASQVKTQANYYACYKFGRITQDTLGYKEAYTRDGAVVLITLLIPKNTWVRWESYRDIVHYVLSFSVQEISKLLRSKARCSEAVVLKIEDYQGNSFMRAHSSFASEFVYEVGKTVRPWGGFAKTFSECASGIHFFATKREAKGYLG